MTCTRCGAAMPADSPGQLCPRCLLQAGLASDSPATALHAAGFTAPSVGELQHLFPALEVIELLGKGGMGAVYKAKQVALDRLVALKILPAGDDPAFAERFTREARALARLSHPNIVGVHDFGRSGNQVYFVMEFVDGVNLRQAMRAGELGPAEALKIVPQICDALQFAHDEGIVHRDIKPENILLDKKGRVKIADFGLAKILGAAAPDTALTGTRQAMGTFHYMAPEQLEGAKSVDHRADIYSLGVTFYEMLTGELPLGRFAAPSQKAAVDVRLDDVVFRSLEKEPNNRYQHASDVKIDVETISRTPPPSSVPPGLTAPTTPDSVRTSPPSQPASTVPPGPISTDSEPFRAAEPIRPARWMRVPWILRLLAKTFLTIAIVVLPFLFLSFTGRQEAAAEAGQKISTITLGAPDPWFQWVTRPNGFHWSLNLITWSFGFGILAAVAFWLLLLVDRIERRAKYPTVGEAIVGEAREIAGYLLATGIAYLMAALAIVLGFAAAESSLAERIRAGEGPLHWDAVRAGSIVLFLGTFLVGILQIASSVRLSKVEPSALHRLNAVVSIVLPTPLWIFGMMMGIWVLRFLSRPEVQSLLESDDRRGYKRLPLDSRAGPVASEHAPGWAYVFGWLTGLVLRAISSSRVTTLLLSLVGILVCFLPWMEIFPTVTGSRGHQSALHTLVPGSAYPAYSIVLGAWVMMAFVTVVSWPYHKPSRIRGGILAGLAAVALGASLSFVMQPYLPDSPNLYGPIVIEVRRLAPEFDIDDDDRDYQIIQGAIRRRIVSVPTSVMAGPRIEVILAVLGLLVAAVELQRSLRHAGS